MRRLVSWMMLAMLLVAIVGGCSSPRSSVKSPESSGDNKSSIPFKIGIIQLTEHPALDAARKGFTDMLTEQGYGAKVSYDYRNAQGDIAVAQSIAQKFVADKVDLILAIATSAAQVAAKSTKDIPILITSVTDPVAAGLVKSLEQPGGNVTGTTDMNPVDQQIELIGKLAPEAHTVGFLYNAGEVNSVVQINLARQAAQQQGLRVVEATVASTMDVSQAAQSLAGRVDAIYVPTDNTVVSAISAVVKVAEQAKLPVIAGGRPVVVSGALATIGIDQYKLGRQTGEMAIRVMKGEKPSSMAIQAQKEFTLVVNLKEAKAIGLIIPPSILHSAEVIE